MSTNGLMPDRRMTEESRRFLASYSKLMVRKLFKRLDLETVRGLLDSFTFKINSTVNVEGVIEKEFLVKSEKDGYEVPVSAYVPNGVKANAPIVVFFHGGGWTICSRMTHYHALATLAAQTQAIWLSIEYRLAPEYKFPIGLDDCVSAVRWVAANKTRLFNAHSKSKIGIGGDSAGGTMAASIAHELSSIVDFQILVYPCVQFDMAYDSYREFEDEQYLLTPGLLKFFTINLLNDFEDIQSPRLAPMLHSNGKFKSLPRALLIAAELDPLVDDAKEYHKRLIENGIESKLHIIKGVQHGFFNMPGIFVNAFSEASNYIIEFTREFFVNEIVTSKL